jgi:hypothetical protein
MRASVRSGREDVVRRFWGFVEEQAEHAADDVHLRSLLQIECFEGVGWVEDVIEYLGPRTRDVLADAHSAASGIPVFGLLTSVAFVKRSAWLSSTWFAALTQNGQIGSFAVVTNQ